MNFKHGHTIGKKRTPEHAIWSEMIKRVTCKKNNRYARYGGRGIKICKRWHLFKNFFEDMGKRPLGMTLERVDNNKGYMPSNCIWASRKQQARNRGTTRWITFKRQKRSLAEWCELKNLNYARVQARLDKLGWSINEAFGEKYANPK